MKSEFRTIGDLTAISVMAGELWAFIPSAKRSEDYQDKAWFWVNECYAAEVLWACLINR